METQVSGWNTRIARLTGANNPYDSQTPPLVQTSTFVFPDAQTGGARFAGEQPGYVYTRLGNPTVQLFEEAVASLEGAEAGVAFASGMGAISGVLLPLLKPGDRLLCSEGVYGSTFGLLEFLADHFRIAHTFSPLQTEAQIETAITGDTKAIYIETPINPTLSLVDIEMVAQAAHRHGLMLIVDNTFMTPYWQKPIELGADAVVHSATKYLGGHGDVIAGVAVGSAEFMRTVRLSTLKDIGAVLSPFDAWLLLRGMRTLALRMEQHGKNAQRAAAFLANQTAVIALHYPGYFEGGQRSILQRQMRSPGAMISFELSGGMEAGMAFMNHLNLIKIAVSLGDIHSLIQHPASMTHSLVPPDERLRMGLPDGMVRLSVGIEDADDLIADLSQAFERL
ncbi:MAG: trans-sulfuration enzyme family protein [Bacilli bacterium]